MKRIYWTIEGKPKAQQRHRDRADGRKYDPSTQDKREFNLQSRLHAPQSPLSGPVLLYVVFYMPVPKSMPKMQQKVVAGWDRIGWGPAPLSVLIRDGVASGIPFHIKRPDLDNLLKLVKDALNGLMWVDDSQVQIGGAFKMYSHNPRTAIELFY